MTQRIFPGHKLTVMCKMYKNQSVSRSLQQLLEITNSTRNMDLALRIVQRLVGILSPFTKLSPFYHHSREIVALLRAF